MSSGTHKYTRSEERAGGKADFHAMPGNNGPAGQSRAARRESGPCREKGGRAILHGMRNSLNTLKGALTVLLLKYPSDAYLREFLTVMEEEIRRLTDLVGRVHYPGDLPDARPETDLAALMKQWEEVAADGIRIPCMRFLYESESLPPIEVDAISMEQMIMKVASHMADVMEPESELYVRAKLGRRGARLQVVAEMGAEGPDGSARRLPDLRQSDFSLVRRALRQFDGKLTVRTGRRAGTTVCLYLPVSGRKE